MTKVIKPVLLHLMYVPVSKQGNSKNGQHEIWSIKRKGRHVSYSNFSSCFNNPKCVCVSIYIYIYMCVCVCVCVCVFVPGSSVSIATDYGVDGSRSNPGGDEIFHPRPWGPPSLLYNGYRIFPGGKVPRSWKRRAITLPTLWATPGL